MPLDPHKAGSVAACMRRYAQYLQDKRRSRGLGSASMPPWDENSYFFLPKETGFTISTTAQSVAPADPNRVAILFSAAGPNNIFLSTKSDIAANNGIQLVSGVLPLLIEQEKVGPLCAAEWFAVSLAAGGVLTVVETILREWPGGR